MLWEFDTKVKRNKVEMIVQAEGKLIFAEAELDLIRLDSGRTEQMIKKNKNIFIENDVLIK